MPVQSRFPSLKVTPFRDQLLLLLIELQEALKPDLFALAALRYFCLELFDLAVDSAFGILQAHSKGALSGMRGCELLGQGIDVGRCICQSDSLRSTEKAYMMSGLELRSQDWRSFELRASPVYELPTAW